MRLVLQSRFFLGGAKGEYRDSDEDEVEANEEPLELLEPLLTEEEEEEEELEMNQRKTKAFCLTSLPLLWPDARGNIGS
jgi:hypothetical protein